MFCQEPTVWILEVVHCGEKSFHPAGRGCCTGGVGGDTVASDVIIPGLESSEWTRHSPVGEGGAGRMCQLDLDPSPDWSCQDSGEV